MKQSGRLWNQELGRFFTSIGFKRCDAETCQYARFDKATGKFVLVLSEVDDLVATGNDDAYINHFRDSLIKSFASKNDDGTANKKSIAREVLSSFLGIDIKYDIGNGVLSMNIKSKIDNLLNDETHTAALHKLKMKTSNLPMPAGFNDADYPEEGVWSHLEMHLKKHYASVVGSVIYLHVTCRPDIAYSVGCLARRMHKPTRVHVNKLKYLLQYLNSHTVTLLSCTCVTSLSHTSMLAICQLKIQPCTLFAAVRSNENGDNGFDILTGFSDADFAKSFAEQRKSTSGYAFFVFGNLVCWKSKLQPITTGSTHEAELIALSFAADDGISYVALGSTQGNSVCRELYHTPLLRDRETWY